MIYLLCVLIGVVVGIAFTLKVLVEPTTVINNENDIKIKKSTLQDSEFYDPLNIVLPEDKKKKVGIFRRVFNKRFKTDK